MTSDTRRPEPEASPLFRFAVRGAAVGGLIGALAGLVQGLRTYPPTAWAAVVEVGLPTLLIGTLIGIVVGLVLRRRGRKGQRP